jgi:G3E family GTPase
MKTPVYTISGFLGAGKTTFLNRLLCQLPEDVKVALIINELGQIAIDGRIIEKEDYFLQEITEGCICCTLKAKLADALISIVNDTQPDFVLIETTGVARPSQVTSEFDLKRLEEKVVSRGVVSFLDAVIYSKVGHNIPIINYQIDEADVVVLNKIDLLDEESLTLIRNQLRAFTGETKKIYETSFSKIDYGEIFPEMKGDHLTNEERKHEKTLDDHEEHDHAHEHEHLDSTEGFASISLEALTTVPNDLIESFLNTHKRKIIRAKGLLKTDRGDRLFQFSTSGLEIRDFKKAIGKGEMVIIVKEEDKEYIESLLPDVFVRRN